MEQKLGVGDGDNTSGEIIFASPIATGFSRAAGMLCRVVEGTVAETARASAQKERLDFIVRIERSSEPGLVSDDRVVEGRPRGGSQNLANTGRPPALSALTLSS